ncbi:hypothetical protein EGT74_24595 [Chitinophaga lutea]|uniref:Uncharacterized protein n=1 Tax=Chitinophaga lutea TaxID=2488634 RepID=A0A3N4PBT8_9BACT|nr:hypothetical protein [Chitinophaga lutea]RPE05565.1 hypothetical protein EGT74_24595 [Chitinophaga lutea]
MRWIIFLLVLFASCKTSEQIAAEKAAKQERQRREQAAKDERARQERLQLLKDMRKAFPCDTPSVKEDTVYLPGAPDTAYAPGRTDTVRITRTLTVRDRGDLQAMKDSMDAARYQIELRDQHIQDAKEDYADLRHAHAKEVQRADKEEAQKKKWRTRCWAGGGTIIGAIVLWLLLAGKLSFVTGIFKRLFG